MSSWFDIINPFSHNSTEHRSSEPRPTQEQMRNTQHEYQRLKAVRLAQRMHEANPSVTCEELKGQWSILTSKDIHFGIPGIHCSDD